MSQHDFDIANATASNARVDINLALKALGSLSSGATEPTTRYANMPWYNTSTNILKMRNEANDAWINLGYVDQAGGVFSILNNTKIVATDGGDTGLLGPQLESAWETGTSTTESLVSPAKVKASVIANTPTPPTTDVPAAIAALSYGAVGTYGFFSNQSGSSISPAGTVSGSSLRPASAGTALAGSAPSGTWRCMGYAEVSGRTLFLRIS
tara:strand:- start:99 stop:728 length:630 start_codon:yes stop_codon:yes gene_type:complete